MKGQIEQFDGHPAEGIQWTDRDDRISLSRHLRIEAGIRYALQNQDNNFYAILSYYFLLIQES